MLALALALQVVCSPFGTCAERQRAPSDSERIEKGARAAQERFERIRLDDLSMSDSWMDHCDETVNFVCFTYDDPNDPWKPPKEGEEVGNARETLINRLEGAAEQLPGDRWIAGQLVRYLVEAGHGAKARETADACRTSELWWCRALAGYAAHDAGDFVAAEAAFDQALGAMPESQRCRWTDISLLLKAPGSGYKDLDCAQRAGVERRFWWLSDPLFLTPGNERRSEHFARHVYIRMQDDAPLVSHRAWAKGFDVLAIRYGLPSGWQIQDSHLLTVETDPNVITYDQSPAEVFEPNWKVLSAVETMQPEDMPLRYKAALTGYAPKYAAHFDTLGYQVAVFRTGDSATIVAGYDFSGDSLASSAPVLAGLFFSPDPDTPPFSRRSDQQATGVLTLKTPLRPGLLSIEAKSVDKPRVARVRQWLPIAPADHGIMVSDVLLLSRADKLPQNREEAIPLARSNTAVAQGEALGTYWEVYGLGSRPVPLSLSVTLVKEGTGWLKRATRALKLSGAEKPKVSLTWTDQSQPGAQASVATIAVNLGTNEPGRYTLRLEVSGPTGKATTQRAITILPASKR